LDRMEEKKEKGLSKLNLFLILLLVLLFIAGILVVTATFSGKSISEQTRKLTENIPFLGKSEEKTEKQTNPNKQEDYVKEIADLKSELKDKEEEAASLEKLLDNKEVELKRSQLTIEQLEQTISDLDKKEEQGSRSSKEIIDTYEKIAPKQAALIVSEMNEKEAVNILSSLNTESLAAIMEKMEAKKAAALLEKISAEKGENAENS
jgi:flagellar motility protein MotE (MotC chaperone)